MDVKSIILNFYNSNCFLLIHLPNQNFIIKFLIFHGQISKTYFKQNIYIYIYIITNTHFQFDSPHKYLYRTILLKITGQDMKHWVIIILSCNVDSAQFTEKKKLLRAIPLSFGVVAWGWDPFLTSFQFFTIHFSNESPSSYASPYLSSLLGDWDIFNTWDKNQWNIFNTWDSWISIIILS